MEAEKKQAQKRKRFEDKNEKETSSSKRQVVETNTSNQPVLHTNQINYWLSLIKYSSLKADSNNDEIYQNVFKNLKNEIKQLENQVANLPQMLSEWKHTINNSKKRMESFETIRSELTKYSSMPTLIEDTIKSVCEMQKKIKDEFSQYHSDSNPFQKEIDLGKHKLVEVRTEIGFLSRKYDLAKLEIDSYHDIERKKIEIIDHLRKQIEAYRQENEEKRRHNEINAKILGDLKSNMELSSQCLTLKIENFQQIEQNIESLNLNVQEFRFGLTAINEKDQTLRLDLEEVEKRNEDMKVMYARLKQANKNLRDNESENEESIEVREQVSAELKQIKNKYLEMQAAFDKRQKQYDDYKRKQIEISEKQKQRNVLRQKITSLRSEIEAMEKSCVEMELGTILKEPCERVQQNSKAPSSPVDNTFAASNDEYESITWSNFEDNNSIPNFDSDSSIGNF